MSVIKLTEEMKQEIKGMKVFKTIDTRKRHLIEFTAKKEAKIPYYMDISGGVTLYKAGSVAFDTDLNEIMFFNGKVWEIVFEDT